MIRFDVAKIANKTFWPLFKNQNRFLVLRGGAGSGKSYFVIQKWIYRCLTDGIKHKILVMRKTQSAVYKSCQVAFMKWLDILEIPYTFTYLNIKFDGHEIIFSGLDDPMKMKSIEGVTGEWFEEATEFTYRDFSMMNLRLRGDTGIYKQVIFTFNPEGGKQSWIYREFFGLDKRPAFLHHSTWRDNRFIDDEYIKELEGERDETTKLIYDKGEWGELTSAIWKDYLKLDVDVSSVLRAADRIYAGIDFGFVDPSVFLLIAEHDTDVYILKEIYQSGLTNIEFIDKIKKMLDSIEVNIDEEMEDDIILTNVLMYADAAEPARIKEFKQNGLNCNSANKKIKDGIDEVKRHKIIINAECVNSCREISQYCYVTDKEGNVREEPVDKNNHTCDALRYGVHTSGKQGVILYV